MSEETVQELLVATRNCGKIQEFQTLLDSLPFELRSLSEFPTVGDVEETGKTFSENAILKAEAYARQTGLWTLADDSGLEVWALGGAPGVYSARYGGHGLTDAERVTRLLGALDRVPEAERGARFVCVIAIASPGGQLANISEGTCEGLIATASRGTKGFGYDPVFIPDDYSATFGELPAEIKAQISHRARALQAARAFLLNHFRSLA
jgi:XTP/dITP diphosphohydrolase